MLAVPTDWGELRMPITWRGSRLRVTAWSDEAELTVEAGEPMNVAIGDEPWQRIAVGEALRSP